VVNHEPCALCGLDITSTQVNLTVDGQEKHFCCQGCARVYQVAHQNGLLDQVLAPKVKPRRDQIFAPGERAYFSIQGMWCAGCATAAENFLIRIPGIESVDVSFAAELGRIRYDPGIVNPDQALRSLDKFGYTARLTSDTDDRKAVRQQERILMQLLTAAAFGMQVMILYLVQLYPRYAAGQFDLPEVRRMQYLTWALVTPALFFGGISFLRGAVRALRARTATMDTLVALGSLSAYGYSAYITLVGGGAAYFDSVAMITTFIMLGRWLESLGGGKARRGVRKLLVLQPQQAWSRDGEQWIRVLATTLRPGQSILVKPGERVPADADIEEGRAFLDESLLTGESKPVGKGPGDPIYAGSMVEDSPLVCRVERLVGQTRLAQITRLVEQTLAAKPPIQRLADQTSAWFAGGILLASACTALGWWWHTGSPALALTNAVAVLVVACPCALGLATPLALAVVLGRAAERGILVRDPAALEHAGKGDRVVFDKTGTLTQGRLAVTAVKILPTEDISEDEALRLAAAVEQYSEHPLARAIVEAAAAKAGGPARPEISVAEFKSLRGLGVTAQSGTRRLLVGSLRLFGADSAPQGLAEEASRHAKKGETIVWIGWGESPFGFLALRDPLAREAVSALEELRAEGLRLAMLSGARRGSRVEPGRL
jgi:heavy metal translocating P-type ATPase